MVFARCCNEVKWCARKNRGNVVWVAVVGGWKLAAVGELCFRLVRWGDVFLGVHVKLEAEVNDDFGEVW